MHGGDIYRQQVTYDFSVNINPIGLPDAVKQVMENSGDLAMQYPDLQCQKLRIKLADCLGIRPEQILWRQRTDPGCVSYAASTKGTVVSSLLFRV